MLLRKLLMHIAVAQGAESGGSFQQYVSHLSDRGFVPPNGKHWVDHIRSKGNEANHELLHTERTEAERLLVFAAMLLRFIYEFPQRLPLPPTLK